tara:strand:+ start:33110 stop:33508 length:399 start_codon:yes stop_codon:yes gene_type:complete
MFHNRLNNNGVVSKLPHYNLEKKMNRADAILENGKLYISTWVETSPNKFVRDQPLKNDGSVDWDLVNALMDTEDDTDAELDADGNYILIPTKYSRVIYNEQRLHRQNSKGLGRNDKCYCGSNKKFKKCCLNK